MIEGLDFILIPITALILGYIVADYFYEKFIR